MLIPWSIKIPLLLALGAVALYEVWKAKKNKA